MHNIEMVASEVWELESKGGWAWREEREEMERKCERKRDNYNPFTRLPRTNCPKPSSLHLVPDRDFSQNNGVGRKIDWRS